MLAMPGGTVRWAILAAASWPAARCLPAALAILLLAGEAAWADCTPASANNVTATCTGTTLNQGAGAPGTSTGTSGYGSGTETGISITVDNNATVRGSSRSIYVGDGTLTVNAGATVTGITGPRAATGSLTISNSGSILGSPDAAFDIIAYTDATVTNNVGATISGGYGAIYAGHFVSGSAYVINSGSIITNTFGYATIYASNATVTNNGSITGAGSAITAYGGFANVVNSGSITAGATWNAIYSSTYSTVINNAGASIAGGADGIVRSRRRLFGVQCRQHQRRHRGDLVLRHWQHPDIGAGVDDHGHGARHRQRYLSTRRHTGQRRSMCRSSAPPRNIRVLAPSTRSTARPGR